MVETRAPHAAADLLLSIVPPNLLGSHRRLTTAIPRSALRGDPRRQVYPRRVTSFGSARAISSREANHKGCIWEDSPSTMEEGAARGGNSR